ncbi:hypothetical protein SMA90_33325, partial [Escherichia coli]
AWARFWGGRELQVSFGRLTQSIQGIEYDSPLQPHSEPIGIMGMVDVWKGNNWALQGYYSQADAEYNPWYSSVNPYFEAYNRFDTGLG